MDEAAYSRLVTDLKSTLYSLSTKDLSQFEYRLERSNLVLCYLHLRAPQDTTLKYFNIAFSYYPEWMCYETRTGAQQREGTRKAYWLYGNSNVLWNIYCQRCKHLESNYDSTLIKILDQIWADDQDIRNKLDDLHNPQYDNKNQWAKEQWARQLRNDSINLIKVEKIIKFHGYPGFRLVGTEHSQIVAHVIQHSALAVQEKYFPLIQAATNAGDLGEEFLPYMEDRILVFKGLKQKYGTQIIYNEKTQKTELCPVADLKNIDAIRKKVALGPLAEYLIQMNVGK